MRKIMSQRTDRRSRAKTAVVRTLTVLGLIWAGAASAELPAARLTSVFPPGAKQGTAVEVTIAGTDLDDVSQLLFSHPSIVAKPKLDAAGKPEANKFVVTIAANAPLGIHDMRAGGGQYGLSNVRTFSVGDLPEIISPATNRTGLAAFEVPVGSAVNAQVSAREIAYFKFNVKQGQRVLIEADALGIDSPLQPVLVLFDAKGREMERDRTGQLIDFRAPADGTYLFGVHDFVWRGGADQLCRVSISSRPRIEYILPPVGQPGTTGKFTLYGRNLPGGTPAPDMLIAGKPLEKLVVDIALPADPKQAQLLASSQPVTPREAGLDAIEYRLSSANGASNPIRIGFAAAPVVAEIATPNDKPALAQKVTVPCEFAGQFHPRADRDWITFDAKAGEALWLEIYSERLGSHSSPFFLIQRVKKNEKGEELITDVKDVSGSETRNTGADFNAASADGEFRFDVKEDGVYRVMMYDLFNTAASKPGNVYRLSIRKAAPDFRIAAMVLPPLAIAANSREVTLSSATIRQGESLPVKVVAYRRDGFDGDIQVTLTGLPAGVIASPAIISAGTQSTIVLLNAGAQAAEWSGPVTITGRAQINGAEVAREARSAAVSASSYDATAQLPIVRVRLTSAFVLSVNSREKIPLEIAPVESKVWETSVAGILNIPLKVQNHDGFEIAKKLKLFGHPAVATIKEVDVAASKNDGTLELNLTTGKLPPGTHALYLRTQVKGKYRRVPEAQAKAAETTSKDADKIAIERIATLKVATDAFVVASKSLTDANTAKQAAETALAAVNAEVPKAQAAFDAADKAFKDAEVKLKALQADATKPAAEKDLAAKDVEAKRAVVTAAKAALDNAINVKQKTAQTQLATATTAAAAAVTLQAAGKKKSDDAAAESKLSDDKKKEAADFSKLMTERSKPKDVTHTFYSTPIIVKVVPAPIELVPIAAPAPLKAGEKIEIKVSIKRLFGFNEPVTVSLAVAGNPKGVTIPNVTIAKDLSEATIVINADAKSAAGDFTGTVEASLKLNGTDLKVATPLALKVIAAPAAAAATK